MGEVVGFHLKPNSFLGGSRPSIFLNWNQSAAGISSRDCQLQTACGPVSSSLPTIAGPPKSLIKLLTVVLYLPIRQYNSQAIYKSIVHKKAVENTPDVYNTKRMGTMRNRVAARLRQLPGVLGKQDSELAEICRVSRQAWSNYKSTSALNEIPPEVAFELWLAFGIPMMWIYGGDGSATPNSDLRLRLIQAERAAEAELAPKPPRRGPGGRIAILVVAGALFFGGLSHTGHAHNRPGSQFLAYCGPNDLTGAVWSNENEKARLANGSCPHELDPTFPGLVGFDVRNKP